ncbi:MAG: hypothetical protein ACYCYP_01635 [Leptospirales bacterium]
MGFRVFQGILDVTILILLAVVVGYLRLVRGSLQRIRRERSLPDSFATATSSDPVDQEAIRDGLEALRMATERAGTMRDRMELLFHDAERWIEDLGRLEALQKSGKLPREGAQDRESVPGNDPSPIPDGRDAPRSDIEKVLYLAGLGHSAREIAQTLGRGEGEVELMLGLSRLSDGRTPSGR